MQIGIIGLGRMGGNMARRLMRGGHQVVVHDRDTAAIAALSAEGATGAETLDAFVSALQPPRAVWIMVPAGAPTASVVADLAGRLDRDDVIIDGGNSHYHDDVRRAARCSHRASTTWMSAPAAVSGVSNAATR
jgi:6-phosphogluconate dehydrogenase